MKSYLLVGITILLITLPSGSALTITSPANSTYQNDPTLNITNAANDNLTYSLDGGSNRTCIQLGTSCYIWNGGTLTEWVVDDIWTDNVSGVESFTGWFNVIYTTTHRKEGTGAINATANTSSSTGQFRFNDSTNYSFANISQVAFWIYWEANSSVSAPVEFNITRVYISGISVVNRYEIFFNNTLVPNTWTQVETAPISAWDTIGSPDITNISFVVVRFATNITTTQAGNIIIDGLKGIGKNLTTGAHNITAFNTTSSATIYFTIGPDTTPPAVTINSPSNRTFGNSSVWINVTLNEDTGSVIAQINSSVNVSLTNSSGNWNLLRNNFPDGPHNITIFANDSAANMNSSETIYFTIDTVLPNITFLSPANNTLREVRNVNFSFNISDDRALANITIDTSWNSSNTTNSGLSNGVPVAFNFTLLDDGNHTFYAVVSDNASNLNYTANFSIRVDTKNATLSAISSGTPSDRAATISFTTDRNVNATVTYGTVSGTYTTNTSNTTFSTGPKVSLTELSASTTYFYRVYTWNLASNFTESGERNFTTAAILESGGAGGGGGGGGPVVVTPFGQIVGAVNETIQKALNITAPKVSLLYITQDTTACWVHKVSEALPPDRPSSFDPCFPPNLYGGEAVQVAALAYFTNGSVLSYTWWVSDPSLKIQPPASSLDIGLAVGAYPLGVDIAMTSGHVFSFNRSVNVVQGVVPRLPRSAMTLNFIRDTVGGALDVVATPFRWGRQITAPSLSMVTGQGAPTTSGGANEWWDTLLWSNGKTDISQGRALLLLVGVVGYVYLGQGKKPRIVGRRRR